MKNLIFILFYSTISLAQVYQLSPTDEANLKKTTGVESFKTPEDRLKYWTSYDGSMGPVADAPKNFNPLDSFLKKIDVKNPIQVQTFVTLGSQLSEDAAVYINLNCRDLENYKKNKSNCDKIESRSTGLSGKLKLYADKTILKQIDFNAKTIALSVEARKQQEIQSQKFKKLVADVKKSAVPEKILTAEEKKRNQEEMQAIFKKCAEHIKEETGDEENLFYKSALNLSNKEAGESCMSNLVTGDSAKGLEKDLKAIISEGMNNDPEKARKMKATVTGIVQEVQGTIQESMDLRKKVFASKNKAAWNKDAEVLKKAFESVQQNCQNLQARRKKIAIEIDPDGKRFENIPQGSPGPVIYSLRAQTLQAQVKAAEDKFDNESVASVIEDPEKSYGAKELIKISLQEVYSKPEMGDILLSSTFREAIGLNTLEVEENCLIKGKSLEENLSNLTGDLLEKSFKEVGRDLSRGNLKAFSDLDKIEKIKPTVKGVYGGGSIEISPNEQYREVLQEYVRDYPVATLKYLQSNNEPSSSAMVCTALIKEMENEEFSKNMDYVFLAGGVVCIAAAIPFTGGASLLSAPALVGLSVGLGASSVAYLKLERLPEFEQKQRQARAAGASQLLAMADAVRRGEEIDKQISSDNLSVVLDLAGLGIDVMGTTAGKLIMKSVKNLSVNQVKVIQKFARSSGKVDADKLLKNVQICVTKVNFDDCMSGLYNLKKAESSIAKQLDDVSSKLKDVSPEDIIKFRESVLSPNSQYSKLFLDIRAIPGGNVEEIEKLLLDAITLKNYKGANSKQIIDEVSDIMNKCSVN